jgi:hypothetical protein
MKWLDRTVTRLELLGPWLRLVGFASLWLVLEPRII